MTPRQGTRGCREETVGKDLPPVPLRLLPAATQAALARASRSAREARQQASLTIARQSNKHDGSAGGFGRSTEPGRKGPRGQTERARHVPVVTHVQGARGAEAALMINFALGSQNCPEYSGLHLTILPRRSNEVLARREKAGPKACSPTKRSDCQGAPPAPAGCRTRRRRPAPR